MADGLAQQAACLTLEEVAQVWMDAVMPIDRGDAAAMCVPAMAMAGGVSPTQRKPLTSASCWVCDGTAAVAARISVATSTVHSPPSTATSASVARIRTTVHPHHLPL